MICLVSFLVLIYHLDPCLSWYFRNESLGGSKFFENFREFKPIIRFLDRDQKLPTYEGILITRFDEKKENESYMERMKSPKSFSTVMKYSHYKKFMKVLGIILFDKEMNKSEIASIRCYRKSEFLVIFWTSPAHLNSTLSIISKLFQSYFPSLNENDDYWHVNPPLFERDFPLYRENFKINNKSKLFADRKGLQIYNMRNAKFNGQIVLMCPSHLMAQDEILEFTLNDIKDLTLARHVRFGAYMNNENLALKTFAFYQIDSTDPSIVYNETVKEFTHKGFVMIRINPLVVFQHLDEFLDFMTDSAFYFCR